MATLSATQPGQDPPFGKLNFDRWAAFLGFVLLVLTIVFFNLSLNGEIQALDSKIDSVRTELKSDIAAVRTELKTDIAAVRTELKTDIAAVRTELEADIAAARTELQTDIQRLEADIQRLDDRLFAIVIPPDSAEEAVTAP